MQSVQFESLDAVSKRLEQTIKMFPQARREVLEQIGRSALSTVQGNIGGRGKVQSWQACHIGTGSGYAAVRAKANTYQETKGGKRYAVGYLTNAIENGHSVRGPGGKAQRYRPRLKKTRVAGKGAYQATERELERIAVAQAEKLMDRLAGEMEK